MSTGQCQWLHKQFEIQVVGFLNMVSAKYPFLDRMLLNELLFCICCNKGHSLYIHKTFPYKQVHKGYFILLGTMFNFKGQWPNLCQMLIYHSPLRFPNDCGPKIVFSLTNTTFKFRDLKASSQNWIDKVMNLKY